MDRVLPLTSARAGFRGFIDGANVGKLLYGALNLVFFFLFLVLEFLQARICRHFVPRADSKSSGTCHWPKTARGTNIQCCKLHSM